MFKRFLCIIIASCCSLSCVFALNGCANDGPSNDVIEDNPSDNTGENNPPANKDEDDPPENGGENNPPENNDDDPPVDTCEYELVEVLTSAYENVKRAGKFKCTDCGKEKIASIDSKHVGMPVINFDFDFGGSLEDITKTNKVKVGVTYEGDNALFDCYATLKVQGSSSAAYPKKNYTIQLYSDEALTSKNKVKLVDSWGKQSKYCLKANYIDYSQARNVVSAKLYGQISSSRNLDDEYAELVNGGAIDGYPVLIYVGGEYHGLYTLNIPKDKWLFGMSDKSDTQAIFMGDAWTDSVRLKEPVAYDFSNGWDLEFCSTEEKSVGTNWAVDSFNSMMDFVLKNDGENFKKQIGNYVNVERCIDAMLYTTILCASDNLAKNVLWTTYDGVHWTSNVYDLDATWGLSWNGKEFGEPGTMIYRYYSGNMENELWNKLYKNFKKEVLQRYFELRESVMSVSNVEKEFTAFFNKIPTLLYTAESEKWTEVPSQDTNNKQQIIDFMKEQFRMMDIELGNILKSL